MRHILRACVYYYRSRLCGRLSRPLVAAALGGMALAAAGCPTVDLGDAPVAPGTCRPSKSYFETVIWPEYVAPDDASKSCVGDSGCHRRSDGSSSMRFTVDPVDLDANYEIATHFVKCGSPVTSPMLTRPLAGVDPHGGEDLFTNSDAQYDIFLTWFSAE